MQKKWTNAEITKLKRAYESKPDWMTENDLAGKLAKSFKRSPESIRWQLRMFRKDDVTVGPMKILLLDIETLPIEAKTWGVWNQNIAPSQIKKDWSIACWSAKWLFSDEVMGEVVSPKEAIERRDDSVLPSMWKLLDEAHLVIAHNGDEFDLKKLNTRLLLAGYPKPSPYKSIDTLKVAKETFSFTFNKMDWINRMLGIGVKISTDWEWWDRASEGDKKYLDMMLEYNKQDVNILEELYMKLRPWMKSHPNVGIFSVHTNIPMCRACGSANLHWNHLYQTPLGLYKGFRCQDCGSLGRVVKKQYKVGAAIAS